MFDLSDPHRTLGFKTPRWRWPKSLISRLQNRWHDWPCQFFYTGYAWTKNTITYSSTLSSWQQYRKEPGSLSLLDDINKSRNLNCRRLHKQGKRTKHPMTRHQKCVNHKHTALSSELEFMLSELWKTNTLLLDFHKTVSMFEYIKWEYNKNSSNMPKTQTPIKSCIW